VSLVSQLITRLKQRYEEITLAPFADGRYEIFVNRKKIYSKLESGEFPDEAKIVKEVEKLAK